MEIITGVERRRRWRVEEKLRIVAETEQPGACFMEVARRHEVCRSLLWNWRSQVRRGTLRAEPQPAFLPVLMTNDLAGGDPSAHSASEPSRATAPPTDARIEITLGDGTIIRTGTDVSLATLRRVIAAVRG
jgi:transposase